MAKILRVIGKIFGETASTTGQDPQIAQFGSALIGTYNATSDVATIQNLPAWSNGFIDSVTPSNQYPPLPEMTGFGKVLSYQIAYLLQQGIPEWDSTTTYYTNNYCTYNGIIYKSLTDSNLNNIPSSSTANWISLVNMSNSWLMPDWANKVSKTTGTSYTATQDGYIQAYNWSMTGATYTINGTSYNFQSGNGQSGNTQVYVGASILIPVAKNDTYSVSAAENNTYNFIPMKGAN